MPSPHNNFSIVITGEWPGSGQSTTAILLAESLNFKRIYAGFLFRKFGYVWNIEKHHMSWSEYEHGIESNQINLDDYEFKESDFNETINHQFQHQLKSVKTPELWDKIVDRQSLIALQKPGSVVEGKVGVLLDKTSLAPPQKLNHAIHKILLTCPPEISAHRVIKRKIENGELEAMDKKNNAYKYLVRDTANEIIKRHLRDWERYEIIYGIKRSDIYKKDILQVDTSQKTPNEVVDAVLDIVTPK